MVHAVTHDRTDHGICGELTIMQLYFFEVNNIEEQYMIHYTDMAFVHTIDNCIN